MYTQIQKLFVVEIKLSLKRLLPFIYSYPSLLFSYRAANEQQNYQNWFYFLWKGTNSHKKDENNVHDALEVSFSDFSRKMYLLIYSSEKIRNLKARKRKRQRLFCRRQLDESDFCAFIYFIQKKKTEQIACTLIE